MKSQRSAGSDRLWVFRERFLQDHVICSGVAKERKHWNQPWSNNRVHKKARCYLLIYIQTTRATATNRRVKRRTWAYVLNKGSNWTSLDQTRAILWTTQLSRYFRDDCCNAWSWTNSADELLGKAQEHGYVEKYLHGVRNLNSIVSDNSWFACALPVRNNRNVSTVLWFWETHVVTKRWSIVKRICDSRLAREDILEQQSSSEFHRRTEETSADVFVGACQEAYVQTVSRPQDFSID